MHCSCVQGPRQREVDRPLATRKLGHNSGKAWMASTCLGHSRLWADEQTAGRT